MRTGRVEAFSDAVIAILITIMVLELRIPHGSGLGALHPVLPVFLTYILSFATLGIYWNNHHHLLHATDRVTGTVLWANLNLLFWLSLFPVVTGWMSENHFDTVPTVGYGIVLLLAAFSYYILQQTIVHAQGPQSTIATAIGRDVKGKISPTLYAAGIALAFANRWIAVALYAAVALIWLVPDRRLEARVDAGHHPH